MVVNSIPRVKETAKVLLLRYRTVHSGKNGGDPQLAVSTSFGLKLKSCSLQCPMAAASITVVLRDIQWLMQSQETGVATQQLP